MKTKQIIELLKIQDGVKGNKKQKELFTILSRELRELYSQFGQKDSERHFDAAVKSLRFKWNSISNKIKFGLTDGAWNYFYATYIIGIKKELCPSWVQKKIYEHEQYKIREEKRQEKLARQKEQLQDFYGEEF